MLDIKYIRDNIEKVKKAAKDRQASVDVDEIKKIDERRRDVLQKVEGLKAEQNKLSKHDIAKAKELKQEVKKLAPELKKIQEELDKLVKALPNIALDDVPVGKDEKDNKVVKQEGKKPEFDFKPRDYLALAEKLDIIDIKRAAKASGSRFGYLKKQGALLEFALIQFAVDILVEHKFTPVIPPVMLKKEAMAAMGFLDREVDSDEVYHLEKDGLYLVGTSEQSIGAMHMDEVLPAQDLPLRYFGFSTCFRREAGAYGKDTKGILRVHQFDKIEMFVFCQSDQSVQEHKLLLSIEEEIMQKLELPYQVVHLSTGDLNMSSASTYDIETWMPGQNEYRETHSTSNCTDYQARGLNTRYRKKDKMETVHTLNGTAVAVGRMIIAIIENYQQKDGSIKVPEVLQKYMQGLKKIG